MSAWSIALGYAGADVADNYATGPTAAKEVAEEIRRCESRANAARLDLRQ